MSKWDQESVESSELNLNRVNLRLLTTFLFIYVVNVILYFVCNTPDFDMQPKKKVKYGTQKV